MPVSSASSERSFSVMRHVKNCLRATMGDERLSNIYRCYTFTEQEILASKMLSTNLQ